MKRVCYSRNLHVTTTSSEGDDAYAGCFNLEDILLKGNISERFPVNKKNLQKKARERLPCSVVILNPSKLKISNKNYYSFRSKINDVVKLVIHGTPFDHCMYPN